MYLDKLPNLNQIPSDLLETIPPLEPGQVARFRSLIHVVDFDAELNISTVIYKRLFLGYRDTIRWKGQLIPIGIPKETDNGNVVSFSSELFGAGELFSGIISLYGDNMEDQKKYMFMMLSNYRKGNPCRSTSQKPLYELIDIPAESKARRKSRSALRDALNVAENMTLDEVRSYACALNMNENQPEDALRDAIEAYAQTNPEVFMNSFKNPAFALSAVIRRALDGNIIFFEPTVNKVKYADAKATTIATLDLAEGESWLMAFAEYCLTSEQGAAAMKNIKRQVSQAIKGGNAKKDPEVTVPPVAPKVTEPVVSADAIAVLENL